MFGVDLLPFVSPEAQQWLKLALAVPAVLWSGWPFFVRGVQSIRSGWLNMFTLIALGTGAAFLYSLLAVVAPGLFPPSMVDAHGLIPTYFEAAAVIVALVLLGQVLELRAREKTAAPSAPSSTSRQRALRVLKDARPRPCRGLGQGRRRVAGHARDKIPSRTVVDGRSAVDERC